MSRSMILEAMYEVIKDSTEWGVSCEDGSYGEYVDGVVAMTETMLKKCDKPTLAEALREYSNGLGTNKEDA